MKRIIIAAAGLLTVFAVSGCADDGYRHNRGYTSMSVGVSGSSYDDGYHHRRSRDQDRDGIPNRYDRDRDGDGVPNRVDDAPRNPHRD
jgi:hypothetical protein